MNIQERVEKLREKMAARDLDAYIVLTSDPHSSEYVPEYYKGREFITGFTGSAGTAVITKNKAGLWTDSRYFLQAEEELKGTPFKLYRMYTNDGDPTWQEFLLAETSEFAKIGFDGFTMPTSIYRQLSQSMGNRLLVTDVDFISEIWESRPSLPKRPAFYYSVEHSGASMEEKIKILRFMMREREVDYTFLGSLDDVCYLFNIRGFDVEDTPVVLSFALVSQDKVMVFIQPEKLSDEIRRPLDKAGVEIYAYDDIANKLSAIPPQKTVYLDPNYTNISLYQAIPDNVRIEKGINLTTLMKAIKNETEIENIRQAFIKDGVALMKFFNWVETGAKTGSVSERAAAKRLNEFRAEGEDFLMDSFPAIIGYDANGAIVHYNPMHSDHPATIQNRGLLLVDSGGQYLQGTTDITRTYAMGETTEEEKIDYTLVLKAHIAGMAAKFPEGTTGSYIHDVVRYPLNQAGKDFNHGTGHGVGMLLSCHEGPQTFSSKDRGVKIVPGMVTSVEPGLYVTGKHGIRTESITLCVEGEKTDFGTFYEFESLTWVPIDTRPIDIDLLTDFELDWVNAYNRTCYEKLADHLDGEVLAYLKERTRAIERPQ